MAKVVDGFRVSPASSARYRSRRAAPMVAPRRRAPAGVERAVEVGDALRRLRVTRAPRAA
jgi:hypothetical protein